jgi:hypothetical protein
MKKKNNSFEAMLGAGIVTVAMLKMLQVKPNLLLSEFPLFAI